MKKIIKKSSCFELLSVPINENLGLIPAEYCKNYWTKQEWDGDGSEECPFYKNKCIYHIANALKSLYCN